MDKRLSQSHVGNQWNVVVDSATANAVAVGELTLRVVLWNVHNQFKLVFANHVHHIVVGIFIRPAHLVSLHTVFVQEFSGAFGALDFVAALLEQEAGIEQIHL